MTLRIVWNAGTMGEWADLFARVSRPTLTQCFGYAQAMAKAQAFLPRLGIIEADDEPVGLVQILERRFFRVVQERQMHRGPLWFDGPPEPVLLEETFRLLRAACPDTLFQRASVLPELPATAEAAAMLERCGFRRAGPGYRTAWLDLSRPEEAIRAGFAGPWRKGLKAAEKAGLTVAVDPLARDLPWLMEQEHEQALVRGFRPLTQALATRLRNALVAADGVWLLTARADGERVAAGLFFGHGRGATYQVGWSNEAGRRANAMRLVLWRAVEVLRERGMTALDLGGLNPEAAPGVTEFKLSMGAEPAETVGLYR